VWAGLLRGQADSARTWSRVTGARLSQLPGDRMMFTRLPDEGRKTLS